MTIVLASIPLMLLAIAIATIPLLVAMGREHRERTAAVTGAPGPATTGTMARGDLPVAA